MNVNRTEKNGNYELTTKNGYPLSVVRSWVQKSCRYGDEIGAGFAVAEMVESGYVNYALTTLACICVEDCMADKETVAAVMGILNFYKTIYKEKKQKAEYRPALGTAILYLCRAKHSRAGDNFWCVIDEKRKRGWRPEPPEFCFDEHVPDQHKSQEQTKRSWRFWVRITSVLANKATAEDIGGTDYENVMNRYWLKGHPNHKDEPDYEPLNPSAPYEPIITKPYNPDEDSNE